MEFFKIDAMIIPSWIIYMSCFLGICSWHRMAGESVISGTRLPGPAKAATDPNVILILVDDQGWGATSVLMDDQIPESASDFNRTPNLEKLAEAGMRFVQGYAPHPNCSPSRASIQTGKSPAKLHFTDIIGRVGGNENTTNRLIRPRHINGLVDNEVTIAELIKQHRPEYATAHFGKWHMKGGGPENHGYDVSDGSTGNGEGNRKYPQNPKDIFGITRRGISWIEENVEKNKPFFMMLAHYATHKYIENLPSTLKTFEESPGGTRHDHAAHAAMTYDLDTGVGMIMDKVKELGISDNTYIIYLADNGSFPGLNPANTNGPLRGWKATLWEGGIRSPFLIAGPGVKGGTLSRERVVGYDLYPTIAEWLGIKSISPEIEGGSLCNILKNAGNGQVSRPHDFLVFHWPRYVLSKGSHPSTVIFRGDYKLHKFYETGELRLYNIKEDIGENKPLNREHPHVVEVLHQAMQDYLKEIDAGMPRVNARYDEAKDPGRKFKDLKESLMLVEK